VTGRAPVGRVCYPLSMRFSLLALLAVLCGCASPPAWTGTFSIELTCAASGGECDPLNVADADTLTVEPYGDDFDNAASMRFYMGSVFIGSVEGTVDVRRNSILGGWGSIPGSTVAGVISVTITGDTLTGHASPGSDAASRYDLIGTRK
jgi:hypothetical protein